MIYDFLFKNGQVFDSVNGKFEQREIAVHNGIFYTPKEEDSPKTEIDAYGKYILPGIIDEHLHIDLYGNMIGANADTVCVPNGVTTCCDGGTCGASNFPMFYNSNILRYETHTYAMLNVSTFGNKSLCIHNEDHDPADFREDLIERMFGKYYDTLRGLKVRMCKATLGEYGMSSLYRGIEIAENLKKKGFRCPVIIHYDNLPDNVSVEELFNAMRPGDTIAHIYQTKGETIFMKDGTIHPAVLHAKERGVFMDSCHGRVHWSLPNVKLAVKEGFFPDIISSDTVRISEYVKPGFSLMYAMTVESACGVPLEKILQAVTINPARALGIDQKSGVIETGRPADITVLDIVDMNQKITDFWGNVTDGNKMFVPLMTMINGRVAYRQIYF